MKSIQQYFFNIVLIVKYLRHLYPIDKTYFISKAVIAVFNTLSPILMLYIPKIVIDEITMGTSFNRIIIYVSILFFFELFSCIVVQLLIGRRLDIRLSHINDYVGAEIAMKGAELDMSQLDCPQIHDMADRAMRVKNAGMAFAFVDGAINMISSVIMIITTMTMIIHVGLWLVLLTILFAILSVVMSSIIEKRRYEYESDSVRLSRVENYYREAFYNKQFCKEVRFFRLCSWLQEKHRKIFYVLLERQQKFSGRNLILTVPYNILNICKNYGAYLYLGWCAFIQRITIGQFTQYFSAIGSLSSSISSVLRFFVQFNNDSRYIKAYLEYMDIRPNIEKVYYDNEKINISAYSSLVLKNVCFRYLDETPYILTDVNYIFKTGKIYSLIGSNGCGKTTLLNILCRLYDVSVGEILYDGVPITEYSIDSYRSMFSSVFQQTQIFEMSIAENIALDKYDEDNIEQEKRIIQIFEQIGMKDCIDNLPYGIHTHLGRRLNDEGVILSGGQLQRIAIARALFRNAKILLFDEPSSALDPIAENEFFEALQSVSNGKIVIYVSHRLSSAVLADEVLFIKDNRIYASGSHFDLIESCPEYYEYYNAQAKYYKTNKD